MDSLEMIDEIRSEFINGNNDFMFFTHISCELKWLKNKFQFLNDKLIIK